MKGVIFQLLEEVVTSSYGQDAWDLLLKETELDGVYTSLGTYPDDDLMRLVHAASTTLDTPPNDLVRWFGRSALPLLAARYPEFFRPHAGARAFLLTLNDIIHTEVRKLYPGADVPTFDFAVPAEDALELRYRSARSLCALAEGLIEGAAAFYGERVTIEQPQCKLRGDGTCLLVCSFVRSS